MTRDRSTNPAKTKIQEVKSSSLAPPIGGCGNEGRAFPEENKTQVQKRVAEESQNKFRAQVEMHNKNMMGSIINEK